MRSNALQTSVVRPRADGDAHLLASSVLAMASERGLRLATAESFTGGLLSALFINVQGASQIFERGFVAYTDKAKVEMLDVSRLDIIRYTSASEQVARSMAEGGIANSSADYCISIAGQPDCDQTPKGGLIYFAIATKSFILMSEEHNFDCSSSELLRHASLITAMTLLKEAIATHG